MKRQIYYLLFLSFTSVFSQKEYSKEISITSDNDLYISSKQDRYYTSGVYLSYRYVSEKDQKKLKKIYELTLGHQMYTPYKSIVQSVEEHDRPFAGYLYGGFSISNFYNDNTILKLGGQIGIIGPGSFARELMEAIHSLYGFNNVPGWDYQIANAFGLNLDATYIKNIAPLSSSNFDVSWYNNAKAGTVFTNLSTGLYTRIGLFSLTPLKNSMAFHGNLNTNSIKEEKNYREAFFYFKPMIHYNVYDATIQGSFLNTSSPVTYKVNPFSYSAALGILFTLKNIHLGYVANVYSKRLINPDVASINFYGSIYINYLFN